MVRASWLHSLSGSPALSPSGKPLTLSSPLRSLPWPLVTLPLSSPSRDITVWCDTKELILLPSAPFVPCNLVHGPFLHLEHSIVMICLHVGRLTRLSLARAGRCFIHCCILAPVSRPGMHLDEWRRNPSCWCTPRALEPDQIPWCILQECSLVVNFAALLPPSHLHLPLTVWLAYSIFQCLDMCVSFLSSAERAFGFSSYSILCSSFISFFLTYVCLGSGDVASFLMTEARQHNTEIRMAVSKVADKMDHLMTKVTESGLELCWKWEYTEQVTNRE